MSDGLIVAIILSVIQLGLAIFLVLVFVRLRIVERNTRIEEEAGQRPVYHVFGGGNINRSGWSRKPFCRLTLYPDFLVACVKSTRIAVRYERIAETGIEPVRKGNAVYIFGPEEDGGPVPAVHFAPEDPEALLAALQTQIQSWKARN